jgi:hypothetical protein
MWPDLRRHSSGIYAAAYTSTGTDIPKTSLSVTSSCGTPLKRASSSSIPAEGGLRHLASEVERLHLAKIKLSGFFRYGMKKATETRGIKQPGTRAHPSREKP